MVKKKVNKDLIMKGRFFFLFFVAVLLFGCQSFRSEFEEPTVFLNSVELAGISFNGVDLIVNVNVQNPNSFSIPMPNIDWELSVNDISFIQGSLPSGQSIRRRQTLTLALPVNFTFDELFRSFEFRAEDREIWEAAYHIALAVSFPIPSIADRVFNVDGSGVFPLPRVPVLSFGQKSIPRADFSGTELAWDINVDNPNTFPIPFPTLDWNYAVNGARVLGGSFTGSGEIAAGAAAVAVISASLTCADITRAFGSAPDFGEGAGSLSVGINPAASGFPVAALEADALENVLEISETVPILQRPEISFQGITRRALGFQRMEFTLVWAVENRNSFGFEIDEFNYKFQVNDTLWAQGYMDSFPRVAANGRTFVPVNIVITTPAIVQELVTVIGQGATVNYCATGNMSFFADRPELEKLNFPLDFRGNTRILTP